MRVRAVFDASTFVRAHGEPGSAADAWVRAANRAQVTVQIPDFAYLEVGNALLGYVRAGILTPEVAADELEYLLQVPVELVSASRLVKQSLALGVVRRLSVYDAAYLALALGTDAVLVTPDRRLAAEAERSALLPEQGPP